MTKTQMILLLAAAAVLLLGFVLLPLLNRRQFRRLPMDQQILVLLKQAKKLVFFKNISYGKNGYLCYVKNKRKILVYPWVKTEKGVLCITKRSPFACWDYPQAGQPLEAGEAQQARLELQRYAQKSTHRIVWNDPFEQNKAEEKPN